MKIYACNRRGKNKNRCEDRIVIGDIILNEDSCVAGDIQPCIIGIADGVGGNPGGDLAAQYICEGASKLTADDLLSVTAELNAGLLKYAAGKPGRREMAATFSAVVPGSPDRLIHIGNTRVYAVYGGKLIQITNDHTTYNKLLQLGMYYQAEMCNKCEITACFGGGTSALFTPDIGAVIDTEKYLLTSDGIHDHISKEELESIVFSGRPMDETAELLMELACENGSRDDMSIVIAEKDPDK